MLFIHGENGGEGNTSQRPRYDYPMEIASAEAKRYPWTVDSATTTESWLSAAHCARREGTGRRTETGRTFYGLTHG